MKCTCAFPCGGTECNHYDKPQVVKCVDCAKAHWELTPSGRIKKHVAGKCKAQLPEYPTILCVASPPFIMKQGIWPNTEGVCQLFEEK